MKTGTRWFVILLLFSAALAWNYHAGAVVLDQHGCVEYAVWSRDVIWAREVGADKKKVRASLIELRDEVPSGVIGLILRDFELLWATYADRRVVAQVVLRDCYSRAGRYEDPL